MEEDTIRIINLTMMLALLALPIVFLLLSSRSGWGIRGAGQMALRAGLPFVSGASQAHIGRALQARTRASMWLVLAALVAYGVTLLLTPLGTSAEAPWVLVVVIVCGVTTITTGIHGAGHPLFPAKPGAVRIARAARLTTRDYLGTARTILPRILLGIGILAAVSTGIGAGVSPGIGSRLPLVFGCLALALVVSVGTAVLEWRILNRAQPASDAVELAWDDLFRTSALGSLRAGAAIASWLPVGAVAVAMLSGGAATPNTTGWLIFFGIPFLQLVYALGTGHLRPALHPAPTGSPA